MMNPYTTLLLMMTTMLIMNLMTTKTSIMCFNLIMYTVMMTSMMSIKMKTTPIPFIIFLTMIGGLMIIFLYLTATLWTKKELMNMKTKTAILSMMVMPNIIPMKMYSQSESTNSIEMFSNNFNKNTMLLIVMLTMMLMFIIETHTKTSLPFRRKLKIW